MRRKSAKAGRVGRPRWIRVRVMTEDGAYVGRVRLEGRDRSLGDLVSDERAYLGLWSAIHELSGREDEFLALHKGSIRYVVQIAPDDAAVPQLVGA